MSGEPDPDALFKALTGHPPLRWQRRLLRAFRDGRWPDALALPTGLGKTSVIAIWLLARGLGAAVPRRLVYVVDRRVVVDQASAVAKALADALGAPALSSLRQGLGLAAGQTLPLGTLRGGLADDRDWSRDPSLPAIIVGTVDMIGSRLLFEGYGVSARMRAWQAGLVGTDALLVLDEAHLVPPFEALIRDIATVEGFAPDDSATPPLRVMSLSATGSGSANVFPLAPEDRDDGFIRQRLSAPKAVHLDPTPVARAEVAKRLAALAWARAAGRAAPARVVVFADSREVAGAVRQAIEALAKPAPLEVELLVGERRVHEQQRVVHWLEQHGFLADAAPPPATCPTILIATAAGEVGIDASAEHMVADVVAWERMVQRFGRVNRRGDGTARIDLLVTVAKKPDAPDPRDQLAAASARLIGALPAIADGGRDASPGAVTPLGERADLAPLLREATTPRPLRPALTRALVEGWSLTSLPEHTGRPEVAPWLRGWVDDDPQVTLIWRRHLPWAKEAPEAENAPGPRKPEVDAFFEAAGPLRIETVEVAVWRAVALLRRRAAGLRNDKDQRGAIVLSSRNTLEHAFRIASLASLSDDEAVRRLTGRTLVLDARLGGLSPDGLLDNDAAVVPSTLDGADGIDAARIRIVEETDPAAPDGWADAHAWVSERDADGEPLRQVVVYRPLRDADPALSRRPQSLSAHAEAVEAAAARIALSLRLSDAHTAMLRVAARLHDLGKARRNWQDAMGAPAAGRPYAKTATRRVDQGLLDGYRHEFGSVLDAASDPALRALPEELRELALHLIAAHHGLARPLIAAKDPDFPPSTLSARAREVALRFATLQRRWGPWGLAWWEGLLRAADAEASRAHDEGDS